MLVYYETRARETPVKNYYKKIIDTETGKIYLKCKYEGCCSTHKFASYNNYVSHFNDLHALKKEIWLARSDVEKYGNPESNSVKNKDGINVTLEDEQGLSIKKSKLNQNNSQKNSKENVFLIFKV